MKRINQISDKKKTRSNEIDIVKAIGIISMVAGHSDAPFTKFVYLFHMAIFFIASGYFYKDEYSYNIKSFILFFRRKLKQLWFPFFFWNSIFTLLNNFFIKINIYTNNNSIYEYVNGPYMDIPHWRSHIIR